MFTGIVEEMGTISKIQETDTGKQFTITANAIMDDIKVGDSVNVNGVCLTVTTHNENSFNLNLVKETLKKSNLGDLKDESHVNLERAITLSTRLGGHILQGHVETVGVIMDKVLLLANMKIWAYQNIKMFWVHLIFYKKLDLKEIKLDFLVFLLELVL